MMSSAETVNNAPVLILSMMRSGSTLLRYCLDTHPDVFCPPELDLGATATGLFRFLAGLEGEGLGAALGASIDPRTLVRQPEILGSVREILGGLLAEHARRNGKRVWCEKSPSNLQHLAVLESLFPDARCLCLYRGYQDVAHSILEICRYGFVRELEPYVRERPENLIEAVVRFWTDENSALLSFERRHAGRCHRLRYEDLVADPEATLQAAFGFLGLPWRGDLIDSVFKTRHGEGVGDPKVGFSNRIHRDSVGGGRSLPWNRLPGPVLVKANAVMSQIGYSGETPEPRPAAAPPAAGPAGPDSELRRLFQEKLPRRALEDLDLVAAIDATFQFIVEGEGGGAWMLDLRNGGCRVREGITEAEYTVRLSTTDMLDIAGGQLNAMSAGMNGRIKVSGEPGLDDLQRLIRLLHEAA
ncbi:MAG TPA: sulfotransferase [Thermoanaerobaculia bacterium]|nr:sulfotransferase [Thermoanaerobaculia bacterium]